MFFVTSYSQEFCKMKDSGFIENTMRDGNSEMADKSKILFVSFIHKLR